MGLGITNEILYLLEKLGAYKANNLKNPLLQKVMWLPPILGSIVAKTGRLKKKINEATSRAEKTTQLVLILVFPLFIHILHVNGLLIGYKMLIAHLTIEYVTEAT